MTVLPCFINFVLTSLFLAACLLSNNDNEKISSSEHGVKNRDFTGALCKLLLLGAFTSSLSLGVESLPS